MTKAELIEKMVALSGEEITEEEMDNFEVQKFNDDEEPVSDVEADLIYGLCKEQLDTLDLILSDQSSNPVLCKGDARMTLSFTLCLFKICYDAVGGIF